MFEKINNDNLKYWNNRYSEGRIYSNNLSTFGEMVSTKDYLFKKSILQVGCGYCRDIENFIKKRNDTTYSGIDFSKNAISLKNKDFDINTYTFDMLNINIDELKKIGKFDTIFSHYFFHLFKKNERKILFNKILSLIDRNGIIVASYISDKDAKFRKGIKIEKNVYACYPNEPNHTIFFANKELLLECAIFFNLEIIEIKEYLEKEFINNKIEYTKSIYVEFRKK